MRPSDYRQWIGNGAIVLAVIGSCSLVTWGYTRDSGKQSAPNPFIAVENRLASGNLEESTTPGQTRQSRSTRTTGQTALASGRTVAAGQQNPRNQNANQNINQYQGNRGGGRTTVNTNNMNMSRGGRGGRGGGYAGDPNAMDGGADGGFDPGAADGG
jgi:hypothetical protein